MTGPRPRGFWSGATAPTCDRTHQFLRAGHQYRVIAEFRDYDGDLHSPGETWEFLGCCFLPYEDGLSLFVSPEPSQEWHIRLQWRAEEQGPVIDDLAEFVAAV